MKKVRYKKGLQPSVNQFTWFRTGLFGTGNIEAVVMFTENTIYETKDPKNQDDWNKLFGCSWGFDPLVKQFQMHENSSRWVWRWNKNRGVFQVAPYVYINGKVSYPELSGFPIIDLQVNEKILLGISPSKEFSKTYFNYTKDILGEDYGPLQVLCQVNQPVPSLAGFVAPGFFGGDETAPSDLFYYFKRVV